MKTPFVNLLIASCLLAPALQASPSYSLSGVVLAGNAGNHSVKDTGVVAAPVSLADSIALDGWGSASYSSSGAGNLISVAGDAKASA